MGRCPVRAVFPDALEVLKKRQHAFEFVWSFVSWREALLMHNHRFMFDKVMPLSEAVSGYDLFDKMKAQKVIFTP
jgi:hypothetical protein